jgi:phage terminase large subunit-like protein
VTQHGYTIDVAMRDDRLLGAALGNTASWSTWISVLKAAFGLGLTDEQRELFARVAGQRMPPRDRVRELWCLCGRRAGKSRIAALVAVYIALFAPVELAPGERGAVLVLANGIDQAGLVFSYAKAFLTESPVLRREIVSVTKSEIRLRNGITIAVHANSFRSVRGWTLLACIFDEVSFWRDESSAQPDVETYTACLPSLLTTNGMLIGISTGYRRAGLLYAKHRDHFGEDTPDVLVVQGSSRTFNAMLSGQHLARAS